MELRYMPFGIQSKQYSLFIIVNSFDLYTHIHVMHIHCLSEIF